MSTPNTAPAAKAAREFEKFTPPSLIAGTLDLPKGEDALTAAFHSAAYALDTERIRLTYRAVGGKVFYLAALASDFASVSAGRQAGTTLANILDRIERAQAEGTTGALAMLDADEGGTTAVVWSKNELTSHRGYSALIESQLLDHFGTLEVEDVTLQSVQHAWYGYRELEYKAAQRLQRWSVLAATGVCVAALAGIMVAVKDRGAGPSSAIAVANDSLMRAAGEVVSRANTPTLTASHTFFELQRISALCVESGGRIVKFVQDKNRLAWEIRLPRFVTEEMLRPLGDDIRIRRDTDGLRVRRGILEPEDASQQAGRAADQRMATGTLPATAPLTTPPAATAPDTGASPAAPPGAVTGGAVKAAIGAAPAGVAAR